MAARKNCKWQRATLENGSEQNQLNGSEQKLKMAASNLKPRKMEYHFERVVARETFVLSEFRAVTENAPAAVRRILEKLSEAEHAESRLCFSQDRYIFHILRSDGLTFFCMANDTFGSKLYSEKKKKNIEITITYSC
ncbi:Vesicle-associated membrane protein [Forsythia ovata]|uniref:Vesicle-associated membrane protein n=1 Tax=Forsythia ovata TaxID=205694 RepID=A0ABD1RHY0_9LAMI